MKIPKTHPRYQSLKTREQIVVGVKNGITSIHGLLAHGRGEAFDYLLGEKTHTFGKKAIEASAALLVSSRYPAISVNGNACALIGKELVELSGLLNCPLEINIFHSSKTREKNIRKYLERYGAKQVFLPQKTCSILHLGSNRKYVNKNGIYKADTVFVPLEDGDRAKALIKNGKKVITIDLNPLSRTSQAATITIVDNIIRSMPLLITYIKILKTKDANFLASIISVYNNKNILRNAEKALRT
ncbi:MAG: hypothetical protein A3F31_00620 [Candidatus Levybacteria bacterium RIFCSPHIGHO2_12_FULL_38_12]|nr:MAG: hypothetical protein A2770_02915 [Candidatus Levybacteria bacterium RIFCSPHIGHO2_01_FULL_38_12]OGH22780.1 MAG: hypothetical protein A3F31_00620 [Candidatus Levybacteria bacterium RIFCSPHIGHO2_12_FULL_38_12]OGH45034.1 MAG: hypothetical protein A3J14_04055 [Candidatus Levybacteria bacterium RIFCSPLOWO2_02_FULL_37_18]OGH51806.1 MAG: hypothetical protein A3G13_03320 [Candidatus Levybacteria bacterium RIFCSPLOWO2_12_FULL_37_7]